MDIWCIWSPSLGSSITCRLNVPDVWPNCSEYFLKLSIFHAININKKANNHKNMTTKQHKNNNKIANIMTMVLITTMIIRQELYIDKDNSIFEHSFCGFTVYMWSFKKFKRCWTNKSTQSSIERWWNYKKYRKNWMPSTYMYIHF